MKERKRGRSICSYHNCKSEHLSWQAFKKRIPLSVRKPHFIQLCWTAWHLCSFQIISTGIPTGIFSFIHQIHFMEHFSCCCQNILLNMNTFIYRFHINLLKYFSLTKILGDHPPPLPPFSRNATRARFWQKPPCSPLPPKDSNSKCHPSFNWSNYVKIAPDLFITIISHKSNKCQSYTSFLKSSFTLLYVCLNTTQSFSLSNALVPCCRVWRGCV